MVMEGGLLDRTIRHFVGNGIKVKDEYSQQKQFAGSVPKNNCMWESYKCHGVSVRVVRL